MVPLTEFALQTCTRLPGESSVRISSDGWTSVNFRHSGSVS